MPIYSVQGPDGRIYDVEGPAGASERDILAAVQQQIAADKPKAKPESGFFPALKAGATELGSDIATLAGRAGVINPETAERIRASQDDYAKRTFAPTQQGWTEAPFLKFKELLGGSLPYMAAPLAAGMAASPLGAAAATGIAGLASATQFAGSNLSRQIEEGTPLQQTNLGSAVGAAAPQAALDMVSFKMLPGIRQIFAAAGKQIGEREAAEIAKQGTLQTLKSYGGATAKAMSAEGITEAGQQFFERLQAGLSLTDEKARDEYWDSLVGGAVLGGALGPVGHAYERSRARDVQQQQEDELRKQRQTERVQQERAAKAAEQEYKASDRYAQEVAAKYAQYQQQFTELKSVLKTKIAKDDLVGRQAKIDAQKQLQELIKSPEYKEVVQEYGRLGLNKQAAAVPTPEETAQENARLQAMEQAAAMGQTVQQLPGEAVDQGQTQQAFPGMESALPRAAEPPPLEELQSRYAELERVREQLQSLAAEASRKGDRQSEDKYIAQYESLNGPLQETQQALTTAQAKANAEATQIKALQDALAKATKAKASLHDEASGAYDPAQAKQLNAKIDATRAQLQALGAPEVAPKQASLLKGVTSTRGGVSESKPSFAARVYEPGAPDIEAQEQALLEESRAADEQRARAQQEEAQREGKVAPERAALQRIGARPAKPLEGQQPVSSLVDKLVDAALASERQPHIGRTIAGVGGSQVSKAFALRAQLTMAKLSKNEPRIAELQAQLQDLNDLEIESNAGDLTFGLTAKEQEVEGKLTPDARLANRVSRAANRQLAAYGSLVDFVRGAQTQTADTGVRRDAAERLKDVAIGLALEEADARRAQQGKPALTTAEKTELVGRVGRVLNELIERGARSLAPTEDVEQAPRGTKSTRIPTPFDTKLEAAKQELSQARKAEEAARSAMQQRLQELRQEAARVGATQPSNVLEEGFQSDPVFKEHDAAVSAVRAAGQRVQEVSRQRSQHAAQYRQKQKEARRQPGTFGNFNAAVKALRGQMRSVIDKVTGTAAPAPRVEKEKKVGVGSEFFRVQFANQPRSVEKQFAAAYARADDAEKATLEQWAQDYRYLSPEGQELLLEQVRNIELGKPAEVSPQLKQMLAELHSGEGAVVEQSELFPGNTEAATSRATTANFMRFLDSAEVLRKRRVLERARTATEAAAKEAETLQKQVAKVADAGLSAVAKAKKRFLETEKRTADVRNAAAKIEKQKSTVLGQLRSRIAEIEAVLQTARQEYADAKKAYSDVYDSLGKPGLLEEFFYIKATLPDGSTKTHRIYIRENDRKRKSVGTLPGAVKGATYTLVTEPAFGTVDIAKNGKYTYVLSPEKRDAQQQKLLKEWGTSLEQSGEAVDKATASLKTANAEYDNTKKSFAEDTVDNALIAEGAKAERKVQAAKDALKAALDAEADAQRRVEAAQRASEETAPKETAAEAIAKIPVKGITRIVRDINDDATRLAVRNARKEVGAAEAAHEKASEAKDEAGMRDAIERLERAYAALYEAHNSAPMRRIELNTEAAKEEAAAMEDFEEAQRAAFEATVRVLEQKFGHKIARMSSRRTVMSTRGRHGQLQTNIKQQSVAQQEAQVKQEAEAGSYPAESLANLAAKRAELSEVDRQLTYIKEHPAAQKSAGAQRQAEAKAKLKEQRAKIVAQLKKLQEAHKTVLEAAREDKKALKQLRKERRSLLKKGEEVDEVDAEGRFRRITPPTDVISREELNSVVQRVLKALGGKANIRVMDSVKDFDPEEDAGGVAGYTDGRTVYLFRDGIASGEAGHATILHELFHKGLRVLLSPKELHETLGKLYRENAEIKKLADAWMAGEEGKASKAKYDKQYGPAEAEAALVSHATDEALASIAEKADIAPSLLRRIGNWLADLVERMGLKDYAQRIREYKQDKLQAFIQNVLRKGASERNAYGDARYSKSEVGATSTQEFKRWFGDSKVVDAEGQPLRVYHGSPRVFSKFSGKNSLDVGHWFAEDPEQTELFAGRDGGVTYPVYLHVKNPLVITMTLELGQKKHPLRVLDDLLGITAEGELPRSYKRKQQLIEQGYDGVRIDYALPNGQNATHWVALKSEQIKSATGNSGAFDPNNPDIRYKRVESPLNPALSDALEVADKAVAQQKPWARKLKEENTGLAFATRYVDHFAGFEKLAKHMGPLEGMQMMYYLRMYDQRMNFVAQAAEHGAPELVSKKRKDGQTEHIVEVKGGASLRSVVETLKEATPMVGNVDAAGRLFTLYMAAKRAERVGFNKLNFGSLFTEADLKRAMDSVNSDPELRSVFDRARNEYNDYNRGLVNFAVQMQALSPELAKELLKSNDYLPYYRADKDGSVNLVLGGETPIKIGNIREQPYLQELVGGDEPILDFMTSSVQNTNLMIDMALRNQATLNAVLQLIHTDEKAAFITKAPISGPDVVRFKFHGEDRYARINSEVIDKGVPAEVLVKGMEGIPTQFSGIMKVAALPATILRRAVTLNPMYAFRQLFRDSLSAAIASGADFTPIIGALKEIGSPQKATLERRGIVGGQFFTGTTEDISKIMRDIAANKPGVAKLIGKLESFGMEADAVTRRAQYTSYMKQGLSEMEATLMALESMNFNKRGASPSAHIANSLYPFFNAQVQSLNVLYKALRGQLPLNDRLRIRQKLLTRGAMLFATSLAYAASMQDDEEYQNATPEQKYGNWFIRVPGADEAIRLPIPFEVGYMFKALPEALYNMAANEHGTDEAAVAFGAILRNLIPGGSSYGFPQALKPMAEALLGKSFYTGRDILSRREQALRPEEQYRDGTTEAAKALGAAAGISPVKFEALVNGYFSTMGMALLAMTDVVVPASESPAKAAKRLSDMPVVGQMFQPNDAGWIINNTYERLQEASKVKASFDELVKRGETAKAKALIEEKAGEYAMSQMATWFQGHMTKLSQYETAVRASNKTPEEKREMLDQIRKQKIRLAATVRDQVDRTTLQAALH